MSKGKNVLRRIAFDLETIPNLSLVDMLPPPEVKYGNTKDAAKRLEIENEAKDKQIAGMVFSPWTARICAAAFYGYEGESEFAQDKVISEITDEQEFGIVERVINQIELTLESGGFLITFNGTAFDFPMLYGRALMLGVPVQRPLEVFVRRYRNFPHYDLRMVLNSWDMHGDGNLDFFSRMILGEAKGEPDYKAYISMIESGRGQEIADDCAIHTKLTFKLFEKVSEYFAPAIRPVDMRQGDY